MTGGGAFPRGAVTVGWGTALPETTITNADLEARLDTSDAWITERTGIRERRVGGSTAELAAAAGKAALGAAGIEPDAVDLLVLATTTPDQAVPATAASVAESLGLSCAAFDLNAACAGFVYATVTAHALLAGGLQRALVIGAETLSRITDWEDRSTAILFGDGAGAVVLEAVSGPGQLLGWDLGADATARHLIHAPHGGYLQMEGREVFRRAVRAMVESAERALARAGVLAADLALVVPHQANQRIIDAACERLGVPVDRTSTVLARTGNTSSASVPLALVEALDHDRLHDGDLVLLVGFGAGMTWASAVLRWGS